jgi:cytochrome b561
MARTTTSSSYTKTAIVLHWALAALIILQLFGGIVMEEKWVPQMQLFELYQLHKSLGLTILFLSLLRLCWRLFHTPPPLPAHMKPHEIWAAKLTHFAFYVVMIGFPLSGWVMVSSSPWDVPTLWFGLFEWPHISFIHSLNDKTIVNDASKEIHEIFANLTWVLLALHVGAALYHHFIKHDDVLARMLPFLRKKS